MFEADATMCRINVLLANCGRFELEDLFLFMFYLIYL